MKNKVTVIGAGNVGATLAQYIVQSGLADVVLFDVLEGVPQGKALDMSQAMPLWGVSGGVVGTNDYDDTKDSDVIVITAGLPRKPGMSRDDLLMANANIIKAVVEQVAHRSPKAILIMVTNPMDAMAQLAWKVSGFDSNKVLGMGGVLDSSRFRTFIALELGVSPKDVDAMVMGGHGDDMVPLPEFTTVNGISLSNLIDAEKISAIVKRTRGGGAEIVSLLKTGSAYYAPAMSSFEMVKAILLDEKRVLPCSTLLRGEYGHDGIYVGVPVVVGRGGMERIIALDLGGEAVEGLKKSVDSVKSLVEKLSI